MTTLFISDLHLDTVRPRITHLFQEFLKSEARCARALYILGDLFEVWVGDDDTDPHHAGVMRGMRELTGSGVPVYFMHGNRDFLIGEEFARLTGCTLLADPTILDLCGTPTLLMHGDTLCIDDHAYQAFRKQVHDPKVQQAFLAKPIEERRAFAQQLRTASQIQSAGKPGFLMDVNQGEVARVMQAAGVTRLIHGHTHRPAIHRFVANGRDQTRIVLGDWYEQSSVLVEKDGVLKLHDQRCPISV